MVTINVTHVYLWTSNIFKKKKRSYFYLRSYNTIRERVSSVCSNKHSPQVALQSRWCFYATHSIIGGQRSKTWNLQTTKRSPCVSTNNNKLKPRTPQVNRCRYKWDISIFHLCLFTLRVENDWWFSCLTQTPKSHPQGMCMHIILGGLKCWNDNSRIILVKIPQ